MPIGSEKAELKFCGFTICTLSIILGVCAFVFSNSPRDWTSLPLVCVSLLIDGRGYVER